MTAAKELKKLGVDAIVKLFDAPVMNPVPSAKIETVMKRGLAAEMNDKYEEAERLYNEARRMDPTDPAPLRYLGELYRHHLGDWDKGAREISGHSRHACRPAIACCSTPWPR